MAAVVVAAAAAAGTLKNPQPSVTQNCHFFYRVAAVGDSTYGLNPMEEIQCSKFNAQIQW